MTTSSFTRTSLIGKDREELKGFLSNLNAEPFHFNHVWRWVYQKGSRSFETMDRVSSSFREQLKATASLERPLVAKDATSLDGTRKWLLRFKDGEEAEMVFIPDDDVKGTLCLSSQVGCTLTCRFCHTGTQRLVRNLTPEEIVGQLMLARDLLQDWTFNRRLSTLVFMGMGEPFFNYDHVAKAIKIMMDPEGLAISRRKITVSTAGVVPQIHRCGEELGVNLAVSLHATRNELRDILVPLNKKYPLDQLLHACRNYPGLSNARRILFEYVMLKDVNDTAQDAKALIQLLEGIPAKVNLIPFNPWPNSPFERSTPETIEAFAQIIREAGFASPVRAPRGEDILAACGQLKSASQRAKANLGAYV